MVNKFLSNILVNITLEQMKKAIKRIFYSIEHKQTTLWLMIKAIVLN